MGEPRPPPVAPALLFLLSLAGSGGQESQAVFVDQRRFAHQSHPGDSGANGDIGEALGDLKDRQAQEWLNRLKPLVWIPRGSTLQAAKVQAAFATPRLETRPHRGGTPKGTGGDGCPARQKLLHLWERMPMVQQSRSYKRRARRAVFLLRPSPSGTKRLAEKGVLSQRTLPNHPGGASMVPGHPPATKPGTQPPLPSLGMEGGAAHTAGCHCPDSRHAAVAAWEAGGLRVPTAWEAGGLRVPTPRTEEAAWAASALTFLLVLLTLAVLYTRLHRKCRRGPSLYWMTSSEEGRETVAAVMKRRLFSRHRRSRRFRQPLQPPRTLLPGSSSDDSSA